MAHALALAIIQAPATRKNGPSSVRRRAAGRSAHRHHRLPGVGADRESSSAAALASTLDESAVALEQPAPGPVSGVGLVETMGLERVTAPPRRPVATAPTRRADGQTKSQQTKKGRSDGERANRHMQTEKEPSPRGSEANGTRALSRNMHAYFKNEPRRAHGVHYLTPVATTP